MYSVVSLCELIDCSQQGSSARGILQARILECPAFLQDIFQTQGSNLHLQLCRQILYHLSHQGSPYVTHVSPQLNKSINTLAKLQDCCGKNSRSQPPDVVGAGSKRRSVVTHFNKVC